MNDLAGLMRQAADERGSDDLDIAVVVSAGRRRVRTRRRRIAGGIATLTAAAVVGVVVLTGGADGPDVAGSGRTAAPPVEGPVVWLDDARPAIEGSDYDALFTLQEPDIEASDRDSVAGVTDDGLVAVLAGIGSDDGPPNRVGLAEPGVGGDTQWLPVGPSVGDALELSRDRLVFIGVSGGTRSPLEVFDRTTQTWARVDWSGVPAGRNLPTATYVGIGPDDRVYLQVQETSGQEPALWSASLTDPDDVRDEGLSAANVALSDGVLTWTDRDAAPTGPLHVRDLSTGDQADLTVPGGDQCNTVADREDEYVVLTLSCGTYGRGLVDERVVLLDAAGGPVVTIRGTSLERAQMAGDGLVIQSGANGTEGTFVYDVGSRELVEITGEMPFWWTIDPIEPPGMFLWTAATDDPRGAIFGLGAWKD